MFYCVILDEHLTHIYVSGCVPPLQPGHVVGHPAWELAASPEAAEDLKTRLSRCLVLGESQRFLAPTEVGVFAVQIDRLMLGNSRGVVAVSRLVPSAVQDMTDQERSTLSALTAASGDVKGAAKSLGISVAAMSGREQRLRDKLSVRSRDELVRVAIALG